MIIENPALTVALALAAGMLAQSLAVHLRIPGIVLLLLVGVLLGPDLLDLVKPQALGTGLELLVGLAVAVILFEGGLNLNVSRIRREAATIRRLITLGALLTAVGGAVAAHYFMGWDWRVSTLFGTLAIVTGPTVINPLLRRIKVNRKLQTILEAEGVLIDPIGAIVAVVVLEVVLASTASSAAVGLLGIPSRLLVGAVVGAVGGLLIGLVLRYEKIIPEGQENVFTLSLVLVLFEASNALLPESGIMAAVVAGLLVGNMGVQVHRELREFKEQLTVMLVGMLFVLLAADVRLEQVTGLGWGGVATVAALMFVIRPLEVAASTAGSALTWRERVFIGWIGPRGIVAAAVASLFAERLTHDGIAEGIELRALVFLLIATTVVVQGLSGGYVASLLGVRRPPASGYVIVGANAIGRALARSLEESGVGTVLIDTNAVEVRVAEQQGLRVIFGSANDDGPMGRADVESRRGLIGVTSNEGINLLLARKAREHFRVPQAYASLHSAKLGVRREQVEEGGINLLFGRPIDFEQWNHRLLHDTAEIQQWVYEGTGDALGPLRGPDDDEAEETRLLPLVSRRADVVRPVDGRMRPQAGDRVTFAVVRAERDALAEKLGAWGWRTFAADDAAASPAAKAT